MDVATLYVIVTLKNGEMRTHTRVMQSFDECEQIANMPKGRVLAWCRRQKILVIAR